MGGKACEYCFADSAPPIWGEGSEPNPLRSSLWSSGCGNPGVIYGRKDGGTNDGGRPGMGEVRGILSTIIGDASFGFERLRGHSGVSELLPLLLLTFT